MKKYLIYLRGYALQSVLGPLFKLTEALFELFVPLVVAGMIDTGINGANQGYIVKMCLLLVGLGLAGLLCSVTAQYFAARAAVGFASGFRRALFGHIQAFDYTALDRLGVSTLITRMTSDLNQVQTGLNLALRLLLRSPFVVFGAMIMAFTIDTKAALWFALVIPALSVVVFGIMLLTMPMYRRVQEKLDGVLGASRENLIGVRVLRAFGREESEEQAFRQKNDALNRIQRLVGRVSALMNPITYVIINLAIVLLIRQGALRVQAGALTQGQVVALYNYMSQILVELVKLANLIITITRSVACLKRAQAVMDMPAGEEVLKDAPKGDSAYRVEFKNASLRYAEAGREALEDVSFQARPGEVIGIIGGTGSGKSTLINLIPRFYTATQGQVLINGTDVRCLEPQSLRGLIGIVPQKAVLFGGTLRDNLLWGNPDATDEELWEAARLAQASQVVSAKGGLDAQVEQAGRNFSGGQRQRLTIARALVRRPQILILDDSASALDFATDAALRKSLRELDYNPTVFIVSQRASTVRGADRILVLDDGRVCGQGTHEELLAGNAVYREIYNTQFRQEDAQP